MHNLIIFASGKGSNAAAIIEYFKKTGQAVVSLIISNKPQAGVLEIAAAEGIPTMVIDRAGFNSPDFPEKLKEYNPSLLVLAGFLWKVPDSVINAFRNQIINIHPALLPGYGGKGMYGQHVHEAVLAAREKTSGITIHLVDEVYDNGDVILQAHCPVKFDDTADSLAERIHELEHYFFPRTIEFLLNQKGTDTI